MKINFKKWIMSGLKVVILGAVLSVAVSYASFWGNPTQSPPNGNGFTPVNTTSSPQSKGGSLAVAGGLLVTGNSFFSNKVDVGGLMTGSSISFPAYDLQVAGSLIAGGNPVGGCTEFTCQTRFHFDGSKNTIDSDKELLFNYNSGKNVFFGSANSKSNVAVGGNFVGSTLTSPSGKQLCADPAGKLVLCNIVPPPTSGSITIDYTNLPNNGSGQIYGEAYDFCAGCTLFGVTIPSNLTSVFIEAWGGGGGGGDDEIPKSGSGSAGGAGGYVSGKVPIDFSSGQHYVVKVGGGGPRGAFFGGASEPRDGMSTLFGPASIAGFDPTDLGFEVKPVNDYITSFLTTYNGQQGRFYFLRAQGGGAGQNYSGGVGGAGGGSDLSALVLPSPSPITLTGGNGENAKSCSGGNTGAYAEGGNAPSGGTINIGKGGRSGVCPNLNADSFAGAPGKIIISW